MTEDDKFEDDEAWRLAKDWMWMFVMDIPAWFAFATVTYCFWTNFWLHEKNTVSLEKYREMVHHNRKVQLAKEAGISAIERDTESRLYFI